MKAGIYTRGGDTGMTSLVGGTRIEKDSLRIEVYGTVDEGTCHLGMARATSHCDDLVRLIIDLQGELIPIMTEIATPPDVQLPPGKAVPIVQPEQVQRLEQWIDQYNAEWIQTGKFTRPGGSQASAALDIARTVFRRAERRMIALNKEEALNPVLLKYFNRLSDLLYVLARIEEQRGIIETITQVITGAIQNNGSNGHAAPAQASGELCEADCERLLTAGSLCAEQIGVPMVLALADPNGDLVALRRMDGALLVSVTLAPHKAFTAATVRLATADLAQAAQPGQSLYGIDVNLPRTTLVGGGIPLKRGGKVIGAVGVSGGSVEQDVQVAEAMVAAL